MSFQLCQSSFISRGYQELSLGIKQLGCKADYSHPSHADVKNMLDHLQSLYVFMMLCLVKHRDSFTVERYSVKMRTLVKQHEIFLTDEL
jgi:hypothetical protein